MPDTSDLPRADATRARLMKAAVTAFAEKGFHGTTTRDIATAAGMSPAALYVHHRSKEELLYLISRSGHESTLRLVEEAIGSSDDPVAALRRVVHDFAVHHARDHTGARIVNYELAALSPEHLAEIRTIRRRIEREIRALVERGVAAGAFHVPNAKIAAVAVLSLGIDIARWYRGTGEWTPEDVAEGYVQIALRIVGAA
ncbi:TetR/AcrR family transcriptional regulator [Actinocorallia sp. API 0066]|uniref:TetR/AcrR family transcriptional regulator n=1 Tax=Actinocorallia sp. API 0066 TaxID=2896846 RepID=UPI001E415FA2|nr:TetR/AcrR family transcriptional regulator [Actinocorallia sp. API 0066]MCD0451579.1 TetR/AcrR family transcriptional regulator [Actinocorallia sp. API 0066]